MQARVVVIALIASIISLCALSGCATWRSYSKPWIRDESEWKLSFSENKFSGYLENNDLQISIDPHNDGKSSAFMIFPIPLPLGSYGNAEGNRIFEVDITILAHSKEYTFNPSMVSLFLGGGKYKPSGFYEYLEGEICSLRDVEPIRKSLISHEVNVEIILRNRNCFILQFDVLTPVSKESYSIKINSIAENGNVVVIPEVYFSDGIRPSEF